MSTRIRIFSKTEIFSPYLKKIEKSTSYFVTTSCWDILWFNCLNFPEIKETMFFLVNHFGNRVRDRSKWPPNPNFVRTNSHPGRTLSGDRPLFWALVWLSWTLFDFAEIFTSWSCIVKEKILRLGCVIAFTRKWCYRYKVNFLKRFFWNACLQREFVIQDFYLTRQEKYPEKVIWMTFQTNIKLYLFRKEFSVKKKDFWWALCSKFFSRKTGLDEKEINY